VNPANNTEALYCSAVLIVGACFMAVVVGNMAMLVSNMNATNVRNMAAKDRVTDAVRYIGMPPDIMVRVGTYFDYVTRHAHPGAHHICLPKKYAAWRCAWRCAGRPDRTR